MGLEQKKRLKLGATVAAITLATALSIGVIGCSQEAPAAPAAGANSEGEQDRDASVFFNKFLTCVQNNTGNDMVIVWNPKMQNTSGNYLDESLLEVTIGPQSWNCAVSYAFAGSELARFSVNGTDLGIDSGGGDMKLKESAQSYVRLPNGVRTELTTQPNAEGKQYSVAAIAKYELQTYEQMKAYPVNVYVSSAN